MSQMSNQLVKSFIAGASLPAYVAVNLTAVANTVTNSITSTSVLIGVTTNGAPSGGAVPVAIGGTAKMICAASTPVASVIVAQTGTGYAVVGDPTTTSLNRSIGIALDAGSTNSVIEVLIQTNNV